MLEGVVVAAVAERILGPQPAHQLDLLGLAAAAIAELLLEGVVLDGVPADAHSELEAIAGQDRQLRRLFGDQHGLPLREDQHRGDEVDRRGACRQEAVQHERLVERDVLVVRALEATRAIPIDADDMVVDQQVREPERFDTLRVRTDRTGVVADLVVGDDRTDVHRRITSSYRTARSCRVGRGSPRTGAAAAPTPA